MNMTAQEFLSLYIREPMLPFAKVVVSSAKKGHHYSLRSDQPIPDDNDDNTIFIRMEQLTVQPPSDVDPPAELVALDKAEAAMDAVYGGSEPSSDDAPAESYPKILLDTTP